MIYPDQSLPWPIAWAGVQLIAEREGCRLKAYRCPAGLWTCGWGETDGVGPTTAWAQDFADQRLCDSLDERAHAVRDLCTVAPTDNQLAAMVSLSYNIGIGALRKSSVLKAHNRGDTQAAARAFALWNKAKIAGKLVVLAGLTSRRAAEAALYLTHEPDAPAEPMPQAVEREASMAASPTVQASTLGAAGGVIGILANAKDQIAPVSETIQAGKVLAVDTLGIPPGWVLPGLLLVVCVLVLWRRFGQRAQGVA